MKNIFVMVFFFTMGITICYAQIKQDPHSKLNTIFDSKKIGSEKIALYAYPILGVTSVLNNEYGVTIGAGANLLINRKFYVGAFGEGITGITNICGTNFGGVIGYIHGIRNSINFDFNMRIGGSYFLQRDKKIKEGKGHIEGYIKEISSIGYLLNPRVGVNFNISQSLIVNTALGYRFYLENSTSAYLKGKNFSGPSLSLQFNFGSF